MSSARRFQLFACGLYLLSSVALAHAQNPAQAGFSLSASGVSVDQAEHWEAWTRPKHAIEIDPHTHAVRPRTVRIETNAVEGMDQFQTLIGDQKAYEKLLKDLGRADLPTPFNIRTAPATVAGVPIVYLKANKKKNIEVGDPIIWYYYHGGIKYTPNNPESAASILDGDPLTYWEPSSAVDRTTYEALPEDQRGPIYYFAQDEAGERRVDRATYEAASSTNRRIEYHSRSFENWYLDIDLGRLVAVSRIVLRFVDPEMGEPFRQVRILGTASDQRDAALSLIERTIVPNEDQTVLEFDLDPDDEGLFRQLHIVRIAITDSRFDKFRTVSEAEFMALPAGDQGGIDYHIVNAVGSETKVDEDIFSQVDPQRQGRLIYYQRERPRLADIEVWSQGDNIALGIVDGGGSVDLTGIFAGTPGFDGRYETNYLQLVWSPDPRFDNRGVLTLDLGARFWLSYFRMVGGISGVDEMVLRASDGTRDSNGNLKWEEIHRQQGGTVEQGFDELFQVRYLTSQIFSDHAGRAGGYNTGDRIREFQLFGQGAPSEVTLTSPMIELPSAVLLGRIEWEADIPDPDIAQVEIRTRTGDRLIEETEYYGSGGEPKTESEYNKLPKGFQGPVVSRVKPGGGWSSWSQRYANPGELVTSPSPRRYMQIQARLLSTAPEVVASLRTVRVQFTPPVASRTLAEIWPSEVPFGEERDFSLFINPSFVEDQPGGPPSRRFDEILLDADPIPALEITGIRLGDEQAHRFAELGSHRDPTSGEHTPWFAEPDGRRYQAFLNADGDTVKAFFPGEAQVLLRLPEKVAFQPQQPGSRTYYRAIVAEDDEVPVDADGRLLNELTYLGLPFEEKGRIVYFAITGQDDEGKVIEQEVSETDFRALEDSLKGSVRYFRRLLGKGGQFPFDQDGEPLSESAYNALPQAERGAVVAAGEMVQVGFKARVLLSGSTVDVSIRDSAHPESWQQVDPGDATAETPSTSLSISVPFSSRVIQEVTIAPNPFTPNADEINDQTEVRFAIGNLNTERALQVQIFDLSGRPVWQEKRRSFGEQVVQWDGRDAQGVPVPPGLYLCRIEVDVDAQGASHQVAQRVIAVAY